jgi:hypothetical protein
MAEHNVAQGSMVVAERGLLLCQKREHRQIRDLSIHWRLEVLVVQGKLQ